MTTVDITDYGTFGPSWRVARPHESVIDAAVADALGRRWLRWTAYKRTDYATGAYALERVSHHWTRRSAWRESSRLRFADAAGEQS